MGSKLFIMKNEICMHIYINQNSKTVAVLLQHIVQYNLTIVIQRLVIERETEGEVNIINSCNVFVFFP